MREKNYERVKFHNKKIYKDFPGERGKMAQGEKQCLIYSALFLNETLKSIFNKFFIQNFNFRQTLKTDFLSLK
jgi:hypothetical protein